MNKYIDNDGFLCIFKKCSICGINVLSMINNETEVHSKECTKKHKLFKLKKLKKEVQKW